MFCRRGGILYRAGFETIDVIGAGRNGLALARCLLRRMWRCERSGSRGLRPGALEVREAADPEPGPGQVRIRVRAAGLNFAEVMAAQGLYPDAPRPPCVVGYEVAGVIDALGAGARGRAAGQRVLALTHFGGHADVVWCPPRRCW